MSQKQTKQTPKQVETKKLTEATTMRNRKLSQGEVLLMRIGLAVIVITVAIILGIVLISQFNQDETVSNPFEDYTFITATEITPLIGFDQDNQIYGDFAFFRGSSNESYQAIDTLLSDASLETIHILFYRPSLLDATIEEKLLELMPTLSLEALFLVNLEDSRNQTIFDNPTLIEAGLSASFDEQLLTFYIEGKEEGDDVIYFEVWRRVSDILITLDLI